MLENWGIHNNIGNIFLENMKITAEGFCNFFSYENK